MGIKYPSAVDDTALEYPRTGFWVIHILGAIGLLYFGMMLGKRW